MSYSKEPRSKEPTVSNSALLDLIETSLKFGFIDQAALHELAIDLQAVKVLSERSPESLLIKLWHYIDAENPNAGAGLAIGSVINSSAKGVLASWVSQSETVNEALDIFIENITLMGPSESWRLSINGDEAILHYVLDASKDYPVIAIERSMSALLTWGRALTGKTYPIKRAMFNFPKPTYSARFGDLFGSALRFDSTENCVIVDRRFLDQQIISSNVFLKELLAEQAQQVIEQMKSSDSFSEEVSHIIEKRLGKGLSVSADQIASVLAMSRQSLHRKLKQENTSFKGLYDAARAHLAKQLLQNNNLSISNISLELGYKDTSSFYKAFHRWFSISPNHYRRNN